MDLNIIYSKTGKEAHLGNFLFGGLSSELMKVLALIDGKSNARQILTQLDEITDKKLALALAKLEKEGYIKLLVKTTLDDDWLLSGNFQPMVVEEINLIEEIVTKTEKESLLETERQAKLETEALLKAELKARETAEKIRLQVEGEEKAKAEAKESARIEMERIAHEAEEARKKAEAEARTKVEEKVRLEAERQARLETEARLKAELKAREDAEKTRLQVEVEEKAKAQAKESTRIAMERIAHEAEQARKKAETEARAKAEEQARLEAERQAKLETEARLEAKLKAREDEKAALAIQKKAQQAAEKLERTEVKRLASEGKVHGKSSAGTSTLDIREWIPIAIKIMLVYLPLIVLLLVGLLHFINLSMLIKPIEKLVSESIGEPVTVNEVHASLWPQPHLLLENVVLAANSSLKNEGLKIVSVDIFPVTSTLFEKVIVVKSLEIVGMKIGQDNFGQPLQWINSSNKAEHLKIEQINFKKINLKIRDLELTPFDGKIVLGELGEFKSIDMNSADHALSVRITPQGSSYNVALTAVNWSLPVNQRIMFDELKARGTLNQDQIDFSQIEGSIYGGSITANAVISWSTQWTATGGFNLTNASSPQILKSFGSADSIDGKLNLTGNFSSKSDEAAKMKDDADVTANFEIRNGKINGVDLARAAMTSGDKSLAGFATSFEKLTGTVQAKNGLFLYRKLLLQTAQLQVRGDLDIQPNQDISGKISTDLVAQSRRLHTRFDLTGKVDNVKKK